VIVFPKAPIGSAPVRPAPPAAEPAHRRLARSALTGRSAFGDLLAFHRWFAEVADQARFEVHPIPLDDLDGWRTDPETGNIGHRSGRFFTVEGLDVEVVGAAVPRWQQPIIVQPEVGILGLLVADFDGVLHVLVQAKFEPGNVGGLQLSPTVQATRSNFTAVHGGRAVPYLEHFREAPAQNVLADVLQSEQGAWFYRKRNRNMVVEVSPDLEVAEGFRWLTMGQLHRLLALDGLVNMDTRTVLSCLPTAGADPGPIVGCGADPYSRALRASFDPASGAAGTLPELLSWVTAIRATVEVSAQTMPLAQVEGWVRRGGLITHQSGRFFDVVGVDVRAGGREVGGWQQPLLRPAGTGVAAFLVREIEGVLHVLVQARVEPGFVDVIELAPTVQATPGNHTGSRPAFLHEVLNAPPDRIRFDTLLPEEGGRFDHALTRYLLVEATGADIDLPRHRWMAAHQLVGLLHHSHYLNVEARTLIACLYSTF
jgi:oxidase EvaA